MDDEACRFFREHVREIDPALGDNLDQRDSVQPAMDHLTKTVIRNYLTEEFLETRPVWQHTGRFYMAGDRYHEAITIFRGLYEQLCEEQLKPKRTKWIPKGMPLV
jgi:hypothetical protein